jgi:two-component system, NarL family, invasion response regulator UvrY
MIVDDHQAILHTWKTLLENNPNFQVIAIVSDPAEATAIAAELLPDIMLVDIKMQPVNGFALTKTIVEKIPSIRIIGLSVNNQANYARRMMQLGARGYLTKTSTLEEINHAIKEVFEGRNYICEEVKKNDRHYEPGKYS